MATRVSQKEPAPGETPPADDERWSWGPSFRRGELIAMTLVLATYAFLAADAITGGAPLGHDEAVYSLRTMAFADGTTSVSWFWGDQRALGLPWLLQFVFPLGETAPYLRMTIAAITAAGVLLTWLIGRYLFSPVIGVIGAAGLALTPLWIAIGTNVWPDGPGAVFGLAALAILLFASSGRTVSWWALSAVPLTVAATTLRYGAPLAIGVAGLVILAWRRHLLRTSRPQILAVALGAAVPVGLIVFTPLLTATRSPYEANAGFVDRNAPSIVDGWVGYWDSLGDLLANPALIALVTGLVVAGAASRRHRTAVVAVAAIAALTFAGLASTLHAETRYLAPVLPWLWVVGGVGLWTLVSALDGRGRRAVAVSSSILLVFPAMAATDVAVESAKVQFGVLKEASASYAWPGDCVIATSYKPQVGWYSGCIAVDPTENGDGPIDDRATHVMWLLNGKRQTAAFEEWRTQASPPDATFGDPSDGSLRYIEVFELTK